MSGPVAPPPAEAAIAQAAGFESPSVAMPEPEERPAAAAQEVENPPAVRPIGPSTERNGHAGSQPLDPEALPLSAPTFGQIKGPSRLWRIPLVSSLLLTTAGLALMRML
jgi:hypothetical protein